MYILSLSLYIHDSHYIYCHYRKGSPEQVWQNISHVGYQYTSTRVV